MSVPPAQEVCQAVGANACGGRLQAGCVWRAFAGRNERQNRQERGERFAGWEGIGQERGARFAAQSGKMCLLLTTQRINLAMNR